MGLCFSRTRGTCSLEKEGGNTETPPTFGSPTRGERARVGVATGEGRNRQNRKLSKEQFNFRFKGQEIVLKTIRAMGLGLGKG